MSTSATSNARGKRGFAANIRRILIVTGIVVVALYVAILALVYWKQEALIFHAKPLAADFRFTMPDIFEVNVPVEGGLLHALHFKQANPKGVVFFLHGNGGNVASWLTSVDFYRRVNYDLFILDYRGYGKSTGHIESEAQLNNDVLAAWKFITPQYAGKKLVVFGRSLGTGLAAALSTSIKPDLTVMVTPYLSLKAMGQLRYPWLPSVINRYPMRSDEWLPQIKNPVMILAAGADEVIPVAQAELLSRVRLGSQQSAEYTVVPGAGHNDIHQFPLYLDTLAARLIGL